MIKKMQENAKSWKTTAFGLAQLAIAILIAMSAVWDSDPGTMPDWNIVYFALANAFGWTVIVKDPKNE